LQLEATSATTIAVNRRDQGEWADAAYEAERERRAAVASRSPTTQSSARGAADHAIATR